MLNSKNKIILSIKNKKLQICGGKKFLVSNLFMLLPIPITSISTSLYFRNRVVSPSFQSREVQEYLISQELSYVPLGYAGGYRTARYGEGSASLGQRGHQRPRLTAEGALKGLLFYFKTRKQAFQYIKQKVINFS